MAVFLLFAAPASCAVPSPTSTVTPTPAPTSTGTPLPPLGGRLELIFNLDWKYIAGDAGGAEAAAFDDSSWAYVDLPHSTKFITPEDPSAYLGISWYRKHFTVDPAYRERKVYLEFEAAMQSADVWVNGVKKLRHVGGYTPFTLDVSADVAYDGTENVIAVRVDSRANPDWAPGQPVVDFQYYGGLYRDVRMVVTDKLHVTDAVYAGKAAGGGVFVTYPEVGTGSATIKIKTNILNENSDAKTATLVSEIVDAGGNTVGSASAEAGIPPGADLDFVQSIVIKNPKLWHPNAPNLYMLLTTVKEAGQTVDAYRTRIGIRRIEWSHDGGLIINGSRFKAQGVNMHSQIYGLGDAVPNAAIFHDVKRVKEGGMDYIRGSHYPHDPAFYDACDELGILVLDSMTGWQFYADTPVFRDNTYQELRDLIRRDRNHPSVVAWEASLNESNFTDSWAQEADRIVHEEYPGDQAFSAAWKGSRADIFIGAAQHDVRETSDPRPIIISEYGDWDYGGAQSTSRQFREAGDTAMLTHANNVEDGRSRNLALPWFSADGYWDFADYGGFGLVRPGLVDMYRIPKYAYYFMQSQRDPSVVIPGVDSGPMIFIANQWTETSPTTVRVYSNCEQVTLSLNGTTVATQSPDPGTNLSHPPFNFKLGSFTPGTLQAACLIGGEQKAVFTRRTPEAAAAVRLNAEGIGLLADSSDARLVFIDIVDSEGTVVWSENGNVTLTISGPGTIVGPAALTVKGGQLAVWVRAGRKAGSITLAASAPGMQSASIVLTSREVSSLQPAPADRTAAGLFAYL
ncbi:MAG: glycoside hydrolase family 2 TIM barrel-domain containing protein [Anaerolineales bacterium]